jgi:hypothetical protein
MDHNENKAGAPFLMRTIEAIATVTSNQELKIQFPGNVPVGTYHVVVVLDEASGLTLPESDTVRENSTDIGHGYQNFEQSQLNTEAIQLNSQKDALLLFELSGMITDAPCNARDRAEDEVV